MTFDGGAEGTPAAAWRVSDAVLSASPADEARHSSLLVVAAHPDDETLMAGGLIARFARTGRPITVVIASDGEGSHPASTTHPPETLARVRGAEAEAAVAQLAPGAALLRLGLPDGALAEHVGALAEALAGRIPPGALVVSTWEGDGHPDHEAAARAARSAAERAGATLWQAPIWFWHWGDPHAEMTPVLARLALAPDERAAKAMAVMSYPSQTGPLSDAPGDEAVLTMQTLEYFAGDAEFFIEGGAAHDDAALGAEFFDGFYDGRRDPWGFETRWYEKRKRDILLATLPRERFESALEIGCSIGVTTAALAPRCARLLAVDIAEEPLAVARDRLASAPRVTFERRAVPEDWPAGRFDLIVLSEVGYYQSVAGLQALVALMTEALTDDGVLVACHWRHPVAGYPLTGDAVHEALAGSGLIRTARHEEEDFVLDVLQVDGRSVARREGLV